MRKILPGAFFWLTFFLTNAFSSPIDLPAPGGQFGAAGSNGELQIWREVKGLGFNLGKNSYLQFRFKFTSDQTYRVGLLGPGIYCPMFESHTSWGPTQVMRVELPSGGPIYFSRGAPDPMRFLTSDKQWTGYWYRGTFTIWRDDGWTFSYHNNRLDSVVSDDKHVFTWNYSANGRCLGVMEDGVQVITAEPNDAGLARAFVVNGQRYSVDYEDCTFPQWSSGKIIRAPAKTLSRIQYPDGSFESFDFKLTSERTLTLAFTDEAKARTVYTWDATTHHLATENGPGGNWTYSFDNIAARLGLPALMRADSAGKLEGLGVDAGGGVYTTKNADGTVTVVHVITTPGLLYGKLRKVEKVRGTTTTQLYRAIYDEMGVLKYFVNDKGYVVTPRLNTQGRMIGESVGPPIDPKYLAPLVAREKELANQIATAANAEDRTGAILNLAQFYIFQRLDAEKAAALLLIVPNQGFTVHVQLIESEPAQPAQKLADYEALQKEFPDGQNILGSLITQLKQETEKAKPK